jgi:hypothetical protein
MKARGGRSEMELRAAALDRMEGMTLRHQTLQPAGTKRKLPEPRGPSFAAVRTNCLERDERSHRENFRRKLDDDDVFLDQDGDDMEQD